MGCELWNLFCYDILTRHVVPVLRDLLVEAFLSRKLIYIQSTAILHKGKKERRRERLLKIPKNSF